MPQTQETAYDVEVEDFKELVVPLTPQQSSLASAFRSGILASNGLTGSEDQVAEENGISNESIASQTDDYRAQFDETVPDNENQVHVFPL